MKENEISFYVHKFVDTAYPNLTEQEPEYISHILNNNPDITSYIILTIMDFDTHEHSWKEYINKLQDTLEQRYKNDFLLIEYFLKYGEL